MIPHCEGFNPQYCTYYERQSGTGLPHYIGTRHQRGHGLGSFLKGAMRAAGPLLAPILGTAKREVVRGGMRAVGDVLRGKNIKAAVKDRALAAGKNVLLSTLNRAVRGIKGGNTTRKPTRKRTRKQSTGPPAKRRKQRRPKRQTRDIFG